MARFRLPLASLILLAGTAARGAEDARLHFFREQVRPILQRCVRCHGGDEPSGELNLTTRPLALKGGESGPAVRPGKAASSLLYTKVSSRAMPPKDPLPPEQVALLRRWIDDGAAWDGTVERATRSRGYPGPIAGGPRRAGPESLCWVLLNASEFLYVR